MIMLTYVLNPCSLPELEKILSQLYHISVRAGQGSEKYIISKIKVFKTLTFMGCVALSVISVMSKIQNVADC